MDNNKIALYEAFRNDLTIDKSGQGYICPICGSGSGKKGTGITENPKSLGHYTCWAGCFTNADAIEIIALENGINPNSADAMKAAYSRYDISYAAAVRDFADNEPADAADQTDAQELEQTIYTNYFKECRERLTDQKAKAYLSYRGISPEIAYKYNIGYDPKWISPTALKNGKNPPTSERLIIPTSNTSYVARVADKDAAGNFIKMKEGKAHLFNSNALYNEDKRPVFIVEGEIDALSILEVGIEACGLGSTTYTRKLIELLKDKPTEATLIICLDNDAAGNKAANALITELQALNISCIKADICNGLKDANEALTTDRNIFIKALKKAEGATASKPDNVASYLDNILAGDLARFREGAKRFTGFEALDKKTGGVYAGLYAIGAISSLGKTTFMHQLADQMAENGENVLFFSLEQSRLEMISKSISRKSAKINIEKAITSLQFRQGDINDEAIDAADLYASDVEDRLSVIEGNFNCDVPYICTYVKNYIRRNNVKPVVIVDYLQILQGDKQQTAKEVIDNNVTELKRLSRNEDIPVFVISSFNRDNYLLPADFKSFNGSGNIEYTADVVIGLQLRALSEDIFSYDSKIAEKRKRVAAAFEENPRKVELICLKNRYGRRYRVYFNYYPEYDLFEESKEQPNDNGQGVKDFEKPAYYPSKRDRQRAALIEAFNETEIVGESSLRAMAEYLDITSSSTIRGRIKEYDLFNIDSAGIVTEKQD